MRENELMIIENFLENKEEKLDVKDELYEKLMFFYKSALKELNVQIDIIKDEFKMIYNYDLIDHIETRIKEPKSIIKKMEKKKYNIIKEKDYVTNPKESGYASYHMIVEIPVYLTQKTIYVKCEIQIRTLAMDFWASFEHKVKYKSEKGVTKKMSKELVSCAKMVSKFDNKMIALKSD